MYTISVSTISIVWIVLFFRKESRQIS